MRIRILMMTMVAASLLLNGCADFGKGAPAYNSTWGNTFGKGTLARSPKEAPQTEPPQQPRQPQQPAQPQQPSAPRSNVVSQTYLAEMGGILRLDKQMPGQVQLNTPFEYTIKLVNQSAETVDNVVVRERVAHNFKVLGSRPQAQIDNDTLVWQLGSIEANSIALITVQGVGTTMSPVSQCATMTFGNPICVTTNVVQPELIVIKVLPDEALICDAIPMRIGVKNIGSGTAHDVVIHDVLPADMESVHGETKLTFNVGTLASGQSQEFTADLKAARPGKYQNMATATSANAATAESALVGIAVGKPVLEISKTGPSKRLLGTPLSYQITISNEGDVVARDLVLEDVIPSGTTPFKTNYGGAENNGKMLWNLPALQPHQSIVVEVVYQANREGTYASQALARASCANPVSASAETVVQGVPAILLEVVDVEDPIRLGSYETYLITTTSQGTSENTNVRITCTLEDNVEYASAEGPTQATVQGQTITFAPLAHLIPREKVTWKVVVRAVEPGDARFRVTLKTDQLQRPVEETESTKMYE